MKIIPSTFQETDSMIFPAYGTVFAFFVAHSPIQSIVLTIFLSRMWNDEPIFHRWLGIITKIQFSCSKTSPKTRKKNNNFTCRHFYSIVSKHFNQGHSFHMFKFSITMYNTFWNTYHIWQLERSQTTVIQYHVVNFFTISSVITSFGRPPYYFVLAGLRPRLNSSIQYIIVVNERTNFLRVESSSSLMLFGWTVFKWKYYSITITSFFSCLQIHWGHSLLMAVKRIPNNVASSNFNYITFVLSSQEFFK